MSPPFFIGEIMSHKESHKTSNPVAPILPEQQPVVTLAQAKAQLGIVDDTSQDAHIGLLMDVATELAETYTNRLFTVMRAEVLSIERQKFYLPYGEVGSVDTVVVTGDGSDVAFTFEPISQILTLDDYFDCSQQVKVTYSAGYLVPPKSATMGVLMLISTLYENREDEVAGLSVSSVTLTSRQILNAIKIMEA